MTIFLGLLSLKQGTIMYFTILFVRRKISMLMKKLGSNHFKNSYIGIDSTKSPETRKVPKGYIGLYVGEERKRYEVPVKYLDRKSVV